MAVIELTQENYQKEVIESDKPVLIDFFATWCGPCKMVSPVVDQIANERPDIKVCKLDVDKNLDLARTFQVMSVPTLVAMKNGKMINKIIGAMPKAQILKMFDCFREKPLSDGREGFALSSIFKNKPFIGIANFCISIIQTPFCIHIIIRVNMSMNKIPGLIVIKQCPEHLKSPMG